jgi:hypothetical protein
VLAYRDATVSMRRERGLNNLRVITCDMNKFDIEEWFDRIGRLLPH